MRKTVIKVISIGEKNKIMLSTFFNVQIGSIGAQSLAQYGVITQPRKRCGGWEVVH